MYHELSEHILDAENDIDFETPKIGQAGTYTSELRTQDGTAVGKVYGEYRIALARPSDETLMTHIIERIELVDGEVHVEAWSSWPGLVSGESLYCPAVGVAGVHKGRTGFREWKPVEPGKVAFAKIGWFQSPLA